MASGLVTVRALVLQAMAYSETSRILRLYTREAGLRSVIAKGARRPKSRFGGLLEPFTEGAATFFLKEGRDLHTLSGFDLVRSRQAIGRSLLGFAGASVLAEVILRAATEDPQPELYDALVEALDGIAGASSDASREVEALGGAWRLVSILGFEPQLEVCVVCGRPIAPDEPVRFDSAAGGVACTRCRPVGRLLDPATRAEVIEMINGGDVTAPVARSGTHRALLRAFIEAQIAHDRPLRALDLFLQSGAEDQEESPDP